MELNKKSYNKIAEQWAESRDSSFLSKLVIDFASRIKSGGTILDIGCGTGYPIATYLSEQGFIITGIDISENLLQKALNRNLTNAKFHLCNFSILSQMKNKMELLLLILFFIFQKRNRLIYIKKYLNG